MLLICALSSIVSAVVNVPETVLSPIEGFISPAVISAYSTSVLSEGAVSARPSNEVGM